MLFRLAISLFLLIALIARLFAGLQQQVPYETIVTIDKMLIVFPVLLVFPRLKFSFSFEKVFALTTILYCFSYVFQRFALGLARPELITESNIELALPLTLYFVTFHRISKVYHILIFLVVFSSGSASALVTWAAIILFSKYFSTLSYSMIRFLQLRLRKDVVIIFSLILVTLLSITVYITYTRGYTSFNSIDRIQWFNSSLGSVTFEKLLFPSLGYKEVPPLACVPWKQTIPSDYSSCFSPALNSSFTRLIWDYGLIIGIAVYPAFFYTLTSRHVPRYFALGITIIAFINGLSVSGIQNTFVLIACCMVIAFYEKLPPSNVSPFQKLKAAVAP